MVGGFLSEPSKEQKDCQHPKPILLNTGEAKFPYSWDPNAVPVSVFRVGSLFILNVPAGTQTFEFCHSLLDAQRSMMTF